MLVLATLLVLPLGAASLRSARRFFALSPSVCRRAIVLQVFLLSRLFEVCSAFRPCFPPREWHQLCLLCLRSPFVLFFAGRRFFALSFCAAVLRPASLCLLVSLVFSPARSQRCLLTLPFMYLSQGVACIMYLFAKLLVFPLGAASSRSACAAVLRPAIFCFPVCLSVFLLSSLGLLAVSSLVSSKEQWPEPCLCLRRR